MDDGRKETIEQSIAAAKCLWETKTPDTMMADWYLDPDKNTAELIVELVNHLLSIPLIEAHVREALEFTPSAGRHLTLSVLKQRYENKQDTRGDLIEVPDREILKRAEQLVGNAVYMMAVEKIQYALNFKLEDCPAHINSPDVCLRAVARKRLELGW